MKGAHFIYRNTYRDLSRPKNQNLRIPINEKTLEFAEAFVTDQINGKVIPRQRVLYHIVLGTLVFLKNRTATKQLSAFALCLHKFTQSKYDSLARLEFFTWKTIAYQSVIFRSKKLEFIRLFANHKLYLF